MLERAKLFFWILFVLLVLGNCKQENIVSLNGEWEYTAGHHPDPKTWDKLEWKKIQVPFHGIKDDSTESMESFFSEKGVRINQF